MRFFTRGLINGEVSDEDECVLRDAYRKQLDALLPRLPASMRTLAVDVHLHDAVIEQVVWRPEARELEVTFLTTTPHAVCLTYRGAMMGKQRIDVWESVAHDRRTQVLEHEVDLAPEGHFIHRLLFWPRDEVTIDFEALHLERSERADRRVRLGGAFVIESPSSEKELKVFRAGASKSAP